jgi:hypothetical protein
MSTEPNKELFKTHIRYWRDKLNLGNYFIEIAYDYEGVGGECRMNHDSLVATIAIGEVDEIWTEAVIARHEMIELLMEPLKNLLWKEVHEDKAYRAGHEVAHRLENILHLPSNKEIGYMPCKKKKKPKGK